MAAVLAFPIVVADTVEAAGPFDVTTLADGTDADPGDGLCRTGAGQCTLRAAIQEANSTAAADTITLMAGTYVLTIAPSGDNGDATGDLDITRPLTISGPGPMTTIIDAGAAPGGAPPEQAGMDRLIEIGETAGNVTLRGLTLREGYDADQGGALLNASAGTVRLEHARVLDSYATAFGGGISHVGGGRLDLLGVTVAGNDTVGEGGGIHADAGALTVTGTSSAPSVISGNTAREGGGLHHAGGVSVVGLPNSVSLTGVTVADNTAELLGGGLSVTGENAVVLTDSTIEENTAHEGGGLAVTGTSTVVALRGTVAENAAHGNGGGAMTGTEGAVKFTDVVFRANTAGDPISGDGGGAGLFASGTAAATILGGEFTDNESVGHGGGLALETGGAATVTGTTFSGNHSDSGGGGVVNAGDRATFSRVTLTGNTSGGIGGGLLGEGSGDLTLVDSSVLHNTAVSGGGFANEADGQTNVLSTVFWDNRALAGGQTEDAGLGGGVFSLGDASAVYENVTITGNYAQVRGGGFYVDADAPVRVVSSTITRNTAPMASGVGTEVSVPPIPPEPSQGVIFRNSIVGGNLMSPDCNFAVGSEGGNLDSGDSCYFRGVRDRTGAGEPRVDAIADNGGPVMTQAVQEDSYAIDGGISPCPLTDARGVTRPRNGSCDIGAYEHEGPFAPADTVRPDTVIVDPPAYVGELATFHFSGSDNVTPVAELLYECRILNTDPTEPPEPPDPTEPPAPEELWHGCPTPYQVYVEEGDNRLEVRAVDRQNNVDDLSPAVHEFVAGQDITPPTVTFTLTPSNPSDGRTAVFAFAATDDLTPPILLETECRLDSTDEVAWVECASPHSVTDLTTGSHTFEVRAVDELDNISQVASYTWTVSSPNNCSDANVTLTADADAFVDEGLTQENFGADETMQVRSAAPGADARSLVRFPVPGDIPASCTLLSAKLRLTGDGDAGRTLQAVPIAGPWQENQVTWLTQPPTGGAAVDATSGAGQRQWDVTAHVGAILGGVTNHGFLIRDAAEEDEAGHGSTFTTRHAEQDPTQPATVPQLVLRFGGPGEADPADPGEGPLTPVTCGMVVTTSITLANDLIDCPVDGLVIGAHDVRINLNGRTIDGPGYFEGDPGSPIELPEIGGPAGIRNVGFRNVFITDTLADPDSRDEARGTIQQFMFGVQFAAGSRFGEVSNIDVRRNATAGIEFTDADNGRDGNDVRDVHFHDNELGLSLLGGTEHTDVSSNYFQGNLGVAIWMQEATETDVTGNYLTGVTTDPLLSSDGGMMMLASPDNRIVDNDFVDTGDGGLVIEEGSHRNLVHLNRFARVGDAGISAHGADFLTITGNEAYAASDAGISVGDSHVNHIAGNDVRFNPGGIALDGVHDSTVEFNNADFSGGAGIEVTGDSRGNLIRFNQANDGSASGIAIDAEGLDELGLPVGNVIENNDTHNNLSDGIELSRGGHTVRDNRAHGNAAFGIQAADATVDGGGNAADGNGEPEQCVNVLCVIGGSGPPPRGDLVNPDTTITRDPDADNDGFTSTTSINTFEFTGVDDLAPAGALRFECRLDAPPDPPPPVPEPGEPPQPPDVDNWVECPSPTSYAFLPIGSHTFEVRAVDPFDNVDLSPATFIWTVQAVPEGEDTSPPRTTISSAPADGSSDTTVSFGFRGTDNLTPGPLLTYTCRFDGGAAEACSPGRTYSGLSLGSHTFEVRATDLAGHSDPTPAVHTWTVAEPAEDTTPPAALIISGPDPVSVDSTAEFVFTSDEPGSTFECGLNALPDQYTPCASPYLAGTAGQPLAVGTYEFLVRAVDPAGNVGAPAQYLFRVMPAPVPTAVNCGQVITQSVLVTEDLLDCASDGLIVGADEITIDLGGVTIDGIGQGVGIRNDGFHSVTITNGSVQQFDVGVQLGSGTWRGIVSGIGAQLNQDAGISLVDADHDGIGSTVRSNTVAGNAYGIRLSEGTGGAHVVDNTIGGSAEDAIGILASNGNRIERNTVSSTSGVALLLAGSSDNLVIGNTISGTSKQAISLQAASDGNRVEGNALSDSEIGIEVLQSGGNDIIGNEATGMNGPGVGLDNAQGNDVVGNVLTSNKDGMELYQSSGNLIQSNDVSGNDSTGLAVGDGSLDNLVIANVATGNNSEGMSVEAEVLQGSTTPGNRIRENIANGNSGDGISVNKPGHDITANVANNNDGWGMYAELGNTDGGQNRATGNVELEQCYRIVCDGTTPAAERDPPDTSFYGDQPPNGQSTSATFIFTGVDDNTPLYELEFQCRLDSSDEADFVDCENPQVHSGLAPGPHRFEVRAIDLAEKVDPTPAVHEWIIEPRQPGEAPETTITHRPAENTPLEEAVIAFSSDSDATFQCSLDGAPFTACSSPAVYEEVQFGRHTVLVRAISPQGYVEATPAEVRWTRVGPPVVTINSAPEEVTTSRRAEFTFTANEPVQRFECSIDLAPYVTCTSPAEYLGLAIGEHHLRVRAVDLDGLTSGPDELAEFEWTVEPGLDVTPPVTAWAATPGSPSASATFEFTGTDDVTAPAALLFECRLDSSLETDFAECVSPWTYPNPDFPEPLAPGVHRVDVRAVDLEDNIDPTPISHTWTFTGDTTAPSVTILGGPPAQTPSGTATLVFEADDPFAAFECALDGEAFEACDTPHEVSGLEPGPHTVQVRAADLTGNIGAAVSRSWEVLESPMVTLATAPPATVASPLATFAFGASVPGSAFTCSLDAAAPTACTSPVQLSGLAVGLHQFTIRATSAAGAVGDPLHHQWTVTPPPDTTAPETTVVTGPPATTPDTTASITFTASEAGSTFVCSLDDAAYAACTSPVSLTGLAVGAHQFRVIATDAAGNADATAAAHSWTVESVAPPPPACPTGPITLGSGRDSWVEQGSSSNKGTDSVLKVNGKTGASTRTLVRFELPALPAGCQVTAATLRMYAGSSVSGRTLQALRINGTWTENGVTWSNQPATTGAAATTSSGSGWRQWTVTEQVGAMYAGTNHGFLIRDAAESGGGAEQSLHSREKGTDNPPQLVLTLGSATPPPGGDTTPPQTTITTGPTGTVASSSATVTFGADEAGSAFTCSLDTAAFTACTSPVTLTGLTDGAHQLRVVATDAAGNPDPTPATLTWTVAGTGCTAPGTVTVGSAADSWVLQGSSSTYGTDSVVKLDSKSGGNARSLFRFALPTVPAGCSVTTATLRLYAGSYKTGRTLQALQVTAAWTEGNVRWDTQPGTGGTAATTSSGSGWRTWSVAAQVAAMYAGSNHGFLIRDSVENGGGNEQAFHSREKGTDNPPQLVITFG
ncbi:MAG TPA: DNRLRE domain-containing protein [Pseudonocardiaceae bacterium]